MSDPVRVGIVGTGAVVQVAHLPVLRKLKGVSVAGLCDTDLPKARAIASRHGIDDAYDDIEDLLRFGDLQAVVICTPNHLHESHIAAAIGAGVHVLVEKPVAISPAGAQKVLQVAKRKPDTVLMVGMNHRYRPDAQAVRSFVQSGELGEIASVRGSWHVFRPGRAQLGWRQKPELSGGGAILDLGVSVLDLAFWLAGNPKPARVSAALDYGGSRSVEQSGSAFVVCDNGCSIFVDVTWRHVGPGERFEVGLRGSKGSAGINPLRVWQDLNGIATDVAPTGAGTSENQFTSAVRASTNWRRRSTKARNAAVSLDTFTVLRGLSVTPKCHKTRASSRSVFASCPVAFA